MHTVLKDIPLHPQHQKEKSLLCKQGNPLLDRAEQKWIQSINTYMQL